jgi:poly-gamma-glutamate capsule biosynthesis protein CapA/YwtB (metallophosphatase superfamily)
MRLIGHICLLLSVLPLTETHTASMDIGDSTVRFLAVGDVNFGRSVGQVMLAGDTLYAFHAVKDSFYACDIVFANLESPLADRGGETVDPHNNLVFTGPPSGAEALRRAGVTLVATANNHALDYGDSARVETMVHLRTAGVLFAGTSASPESLYAPVVFVRKSIRFAFFAVTDIMNRTGTGWRKYVAAADTGKLFPRVRAVRSSVDVVMLSYHGGTEYADQPTAATRQFAYAALSAGVDLFLGHHPHVPHLVEQVGKKYIVYSMGNFVFQQPARWWTQYSFAFAGTFVKGDSSTALMSAACLPVRCGYQPSFLTPGPESFRVHQRTQLYPSRLVGEVQSW